ncbi:MAG TPA: NAD-dependent epimerase/dehydratase family protein [Propylenella sp.]|nr:NAD-dependent epimerase/dehydratase family protein [Propylenella sp.]
MRLLIIGGTGMIGPGVARAGLKAGWITTIVHRGRTHTSLPETVESIRLNRNSTRLAKLLHERRFDVVVDLAAYSGRDAETLVACSPPGQRVIVASTVLVHGGAVPRPLNEASPVAPLSPYAAAKKALEDMIKESARDGRVAATIVRLGACYREGTYLDGQVFEDTYWLWPLLNRQPSLLADSGEALWSVMHADDAGAAIVALAASDSAIGDTVLVADDRRLAWRDYYALAANAIGGCFSPAYVPADTIIAEIGEGSFLEEMSRYDQVYDLSRLRALIGDAAGQTDLEAGLARTVRHLVAAGSQRRTKTVSQALAIVRRHTAAANAR